MSDDQHRSEKMEHKGHGMDFGNIPNLDDKRPQDAIFQEQNHEMHQGDCKTNEKCDQKFKMNKEMEREEKKQQCGKKGGSCH